MTLQWHHHANAVGGRGRYRITQLPTGRWEARQFTVADHQLLKVMQCPSEDEAKGVCELWDRGCVFDFAHNRERLGGGAGCRM
jgi:hypothetical protein